MAVGTVTLFFTLLSILAVVTAAAVMASFLTGDRYGVIAGLRPVALELAAAVATTAMLGSLYLSEVAGYEPCRLCWVQRFFMYPAALILLAALATRWRSEASAGRESRAGRRLVVLGALLAALGLPVSAFHRYEQAVGGIGDFCDQANPCSLVWIDHFGFITTPLMAAAGFAAVVALCAVVLTGPEAADTATADVDPKLLYAPSDESDDQSAHQPEVEHH